MTPESFAETLIEAARQVVNETPGERLATARRIHESLARRHRKSRRRLHIVAAIMATLFGSTAFAWFAGWRPPWSPAPAVTVPEPARDRIRSTPPARQPSTPVVSPAVPSLPDGAAPSVAPSGAVAPPAPAAQLELQPAQSPPPPTSPAPPVPAAPPAVTPHPPAPATVPRGEPRPGLTGSSVRVSPPEPALRENAAPAMPDIEPARSEELAYYRRAHDAHFRGSDPLAALAAWDAYLARYPEGQLALEARYDRALALIKLQRWTAAVAALAAFADAPAGSYRQAEAARLLDAVRRR